MLPAPRALLGRQHQGLFIGVLKALPFGPSGALCLRTILIHGSLAGIGGSVADINYLAILEYWAPWSLSFLEPHLIRGAGAAITIYIGVRLGVIKRRTSGSNVTPFSLTPQFIEVARKTRVWLLTVSTVLAFNPANR